MCKRVILLSLVPWCIFVPSQGVRMTALKESLKELLPFKPELQLASKYMSYGRVNSTIVNKELSECENFHVVHTLDPVDEALHEKDRNHKVHSFGDYVHSDDSAGKQGPFKVGSFSVYYFLRRSWNSGPHQYFKWVWQASADGMCDPNNPNIWVVWRGCKHTVAAMAPSGRSSAEVVCGAGSGKLHFNRAFSYLCLNDKSGHYKPNMKTLESHGLEGAWHTALYNTWAPLAVDEIVLRKKKAGGAASNSSSDVRNVASYSNLDEGVSGACFLRRSAEEIQNKENAVTTKIESAMQDQFDYLAENVLSFE